MKRIMLLVFCLTILSPPAYAQSDADLIQQALAAAARRAQEAAAVIKWNADYTYETLKEGTNTWVCYTGPARRVDGRSPCNARALRTLTGSHRTASSGRRVRTRRQSARW